jgi:hypothetical protein
MTWELTEDLENEIIEALENGVGLLKWCKGDDRPSRSTVLKWQRENKDFRAKCAHAREAAGELAAENQGEIIERTLSGEIPSDIARVAISGLQWRAAKLASKVYGDSTTLRGDKDNPVAIASIQIIDNVPKD